MPCSRGDNAVCRCWRAPARENFALWTVVDSWIAKSESRARRASARRPRRVESLQILQGSAAHRDGARHRGLYLNPLSRTLASTRKRKFRPSTGAIPSCRCGWDRANCARVTTRGSDFDLNRLVALCRRCHEQTDAPYSRGRLVVAALGDGRFTFRVVTRRAKWAANHEGLFLPTYRR